MTPADLGAADTVSALPGAPGSRPASADGAVITAAVPAADLEAAVHQLAGTGEARLADMFASGGDPAPGGGPASGTGPVVLRLVWALDAARQYLVTESAVEAGQYPPLSDIAPAAFHEECEIYEQFGIRPAGGKPLNRVALPPHAGPDFPRLGRPPAQEPAEVRAPHLVGGQAFEFPFGPVRQAGVESLYYGLVTSGEEIVDLYLFTWHKHRGVEWRLRGLRPREALFHVERMEGLGAVSGGWAFAAAAEMALGCEPPAEALRARAVALELERLYNHAAATAALCQSTGLAVGQAAAEIALERLLRVNAEAFGHRYLFGVVDIGGARRGPDAAALRRELSGAYGELRRAADALLGTNSFLDRLEATGILVADTARRLGMVGPVARAAGLTLDARADHPAQPYSAFPPVVASGEGGDALARFTVMLAEAGESVRLIGELLDAGAGAGSAGPQDPGTGRAGRWGLGWAESSRGEALAWVALDADGRISRARLRPASARNWRGFDDACRSQNVFTDIPIIEASFWLTVAGTSR
jgi:Ni,Fe-hydrogenase III large subunit